MNPPPGPTELIAGDTNYGFYGEVPTEDLITTDELSLSVGISEGIPNIDPPSWFKFSYNEQILFIPKFQIRHSISWDVLNSNGLVHGDQIITINNVRFKVRLLEGLNPGSDNPNLARNGTSNPEATHHSEWNRLMYSVCSTSFSSETIEKFLHIPEEELLLTTTQGSSSWCKEEFGGEAVIRGTGVNIDDYRMRPIGNFGSNYGWRPVLEVVV